MSQNGPDQDPWGKPGQSSGPKQSDNSSDKQNENGWGARDNKNQEQSPPDIEEVFNNLLKKYCHVFSLIFKSNSSARALLLHGLVLFSSEISQT